MKIRGAPLIGAAAAYALALTAYYSKAENKQQLLEELEYSATMLRKTRPTAVNLFWAVERILNKARKKEGEVKEIVQTIIEEAEKISDEDAEANRKMGFYGAQLLNNGDVILTHCNAGSLATVEYGTALGVIRAATAQGKKIKVVATETRPLLQGARLTAYELKRDGIPVRLITDSMVGYVMFNGLINKVIVGADRIVRDAVFNKIGTYTIAVLAKEHNIPFYVAAPTSTFDLVRSTEEVEIEQRKPEEVLYCGSKRTAPEDIEVLNPAFDATPLEYVTAIICEKGVFSPSEILTVYKDETKVR
jgi:methylthioribose-1-phosphate isomerase